MFKIECNQRIGKYLGELIRKQYGSRRDFGRQYLIEQGNTNPSLEEINNMSNRLTQIVKGNKAIQIFDLPFFTKMLGISCEQLLSAGECAVPVADRVTNYSIACSNDPAEWEKYIHREDKLILNCDEYCQTVLDYALLFRNYAFIKYLMDHKYIWFDSRNEYDFIQTFGAGTSIERRQVGAVDYGLEGKLKTEDALRMDLIALACDHNDMQMLDALRARENPQLYFKVHGFINLDIDFDSFYDERMVRHIADAGNDVLDYFTDSFEICDKARYKDGSSDVHTFMFPYISQLLDFLIINGSPFAETAIKKALEHNSKTYQKLRALILSVKNDPRFNEDYMKDWWIKACEQDLDFNENGNIVAFWAVYSSLNAGHKIDGIITNVVHTTKKPADPILKHLAAELNESYKRIKDLKEHLVEI